MNALIIYFTKFGNTRRIAEAIAETLKPVGTVQVVSFEELQASAL